MAQIPYTISDFSRGVHIDENLADKGYVKEAQGIDIYGTGAGNAINSIHTPGIIIPSQEMVQENEGAVSAGTNINTAIRWIQPFNGKTWGINEDSLILANAEPTSQITQTWYEVSAISSNTLDGGLIPFGTNLYYAQNTVLGKTDGTGTNNNFKTFSGDGLNPHPMKQFAGKLCIGDGRYLATLDSDESTFNATELTLPARTRIISLDVWNEFLAMGAYFTPLGSSSPTISRLFLWNGSDTTVTDVIDLPFTNIINVISNDNLLWIFGYSQLEHGLVYVYNGATLQKAFSLPGFISDGRGAIGRFQGNIIVGTFGSDTNEKGGIWTFGRFDSEKPYAASLSHLMPGLQVSATNVTALYAQGDTILAAFEDLNSDFAVARSDNDQFPDSGPLLQTLPLHFGLPELEKTFLSIKPDLEALGTTTGSTFEILYRTNASDSFISLKTINASDDNISPLIPLRGVHGKRIEFQFKWVTTSNNPLRLRSFTMYYSPKGKSK